jgi:leukotriene-A4 hydrolase
VFLERLLSSESLSASDANLLGKTYSLLQTQNVELSSRYYQLALKAKDHSAYQPAADLLSTVGRMKFVRPLYRALALCDKELAKKTFEKNREFYHPICRGLVEKDLFEK